MNKNKRKIAIVLLIVVVFAAMFMLSACNNVSVARGKEIDAAKYLTAMDNFDAEIEKNGVTIKYSLKVNTEYESVEVYTNSAEVGNVKTVSQYKGTRDSFEQYELVIDGNKAYLKSESEYSTKSSDKKLKETEKEVAEIYYEYSDNTLYVIQKNNKKKWEAVSVIKYASDYEFSMIEHFARNLYNYCGVEIVEQYDYVDFEYGSGFYKLKDSALEEKRKERESVSNDNNKYAYEYGKAHIKLSFSKDGLFLGCDTLSNEKLTVVKTSTSSTSYPTVINRDETRTTVSEGKSVLKTSVKYKGKVKIPSYTK